MGYEDDGHAIVVQAAQQGVKSVFGGEVDTCCRFIENKQGGILGQRCCNQYALLLAARKINKRH